MARAPVRSIMVGNGALWTTRAAVSVKRVIKHLLTTLVVKCHDYICSLYGEVF